MAGIWEDLLNKKPGALEEFKKTPAPYSPQLQAEQPQLVQADLTPQDFGVGVQNAYTQPTVTQEPSKIEAALNKSNDLYEKANLAQMDALQQGARLESAHYTNVAKNQEKNAADLEKLNIESEEKKNAEREKVESVYNEYKQSKVDPNNWYNSKSTAGKVTAGIGLILGGMGAGLTGGPNQALQTMFKAIDADISSQEKGIEIKRDGYTMAEKSYKNLVDSLGDKQKAKLVAQANSLETMENQFKSRMANVKGEQAQAQGLQAMAQIQEKRAETIAKIEKLNSSGIDSDRFVPGYGVALSKDDASKLKEANASYTQGTRAIDALIAMRKEFGAEAFTGENAAKAKALARAAQLSLKKSAQLGVLSASDLPFLEEQIPSDPTAFGQVVARLSQTRTNMDRDHNAYMEAYGLASQRSAKEFGPKDTKESRLQNAKVGK